MSGFGTTQWGVSPWGLSDGGGDETVVDSVSTTDVVALVRAATVSVSDSVTATDAVDLRHFVSKSDTATAADSASLEFVHAVTVADSATVTDTSINFNSHTVSKSDGVSATDTVALIPPENFADTVTTVDAAVTGFSFGRSASDTVAAADAASKTFMVTVSKADTVTAVDFARDAADLVFTFTDAVNIVDAFTTPALPHATLVSPRDGDKNIVPDEPIIVEIDPMTFVVGFGDVVIKVNNTVAWQQGGAWNGWAGRLKFNPLGVGRFTLFAPDGFPYDSKVNVEFSFPFG